MLRYSVFAPRSSRSCVRRGRDFCCETHEMGAGALGVRIGARQLGVSCSPAPILRATASSGADRWIVLFGTFVCLTMLIVIRLHKHNQSREDSLHLIGMEKRESPSTAV